MQQNYNGPLTLVTLTARPFSDFVGADLDNFSIIAE